MLISQTPLRISFAGGGTDFDDYFRTFGGETIGAAIDKYIFVYVKERFDRKYVINWRKTEFVESIDQIEHELVREALRMADIQPGFEVITTADIPSEGSGLGSSSTLTVGLLNAAFTYQNQQCSNAQLAKLACQIEIEKLGHFLGRQDQSFAAHGGIQHLIFHPNGEVETERVTLSTETTRHLNQDTLLFYTGTTRKASSILQKKITDIKKKEEGYHRLKGLVRPTRSALEKGDLEQFGKLMQDGWNTKKQLADGVSNAEIDLMYEKAIKAGAFGGKICGAGGGGFLLVVCPVERQRQIRQALSNYAEMPFQFEHDGAKILFNVRRPMWKTI